MLKIKTLVLLWGTLIHAHEMEINDRQKNDQAQMKKMYDRCVKQDCGRRSGIPKQKCLNKCDISFPQNGPHKGEEELDRMRIKLNKISTDLHLCISKCAKDIGQFGITERSKIKKCEDNCLLDYIYETRELGS